MRTEVKKMAEEMDKVLTENKHKGECGWLEEDGYYLLKKFNEEVYEFTSEIIDTLRNGEYDPQKIKKEGVDVCNMVMMLCDKFGNLLNTDVRKFDDGIRGNVENNKTNNSYGNNELTYSSTTDRTTFPFDSGNKTNVNNLSTKNYGLLTTDGIDFSNQKGEL